LNRGPAKITFPPGGGRKKILTREGQEKFQISKKANFVLGNEVWRLELVCDLGFGI
jgi:hypothetical protein